MNFLSKVLLSGAIGLITLNAQATTTVESCSFKVFESKVEVQFVSKNLDKLVGKVVQNGEVTHESTDIRKISYKRVDPSKPADLSVFQNTVAMNFLRYNLTKLDHALLESVEFTEIDAAGNSDGSTGASMLLVKTKTDTYVFGQVGMAESECEYTLKVQN